MTVRNCQECSKNLPSWAEFCPFCGEKYRATAVLSPIAGPNVGDSASPGEIDGPVKTEILFLGTTREAYTAEAKSIANDAQPVRKARTEKLPSTTVVVNHDALAHFDEPAELEDWEFEEPVSLRSRGQIVVAALAALLTVGALVAGGIVIAGQDAEETVAAAASVATAAEEPAEETSEPAPLPELREFEVRLGGPTQASVHYGADKVLDVKTAKGSRYDTVEQRANAVVVRLTHVAKKQRSERLEDGRFVARTNGDRYEVVWDDGSAHPFRVKDITRHDVGKKGELAIEANLQADALTDLFRTKIAPVGRSNI